MAEPPPSTVLNLSSSCAFVILSFDLPSSRGPSSDSALPPPQTAETLCPQEAFLGSSQRHSCLLRDEAGTPCSGWMCPISPAGYYDLKGRALCVFISYSSESAAQCWVCSRSAIQMHCWNKVLMLGVCMLRGMWSDPPLPDVYAWLGAVCCWRHLFGGRGLNMSKS